MAKYLDSAGVTYLWSKIKEQIGKQIGSHAGVISSDNVLGHIKSKAHSGGVTLTSSTTAGRYYPVYTDSDGLAFVNVPWVDPTPAQQYGPASADVLGLVKIGTGIKIDPNGTISVDKYSLPAASVTALGGIKSGDYITVSNTGDVTLPIMTTAEITDLFNSAWYGIAN